MAATATVDKLKWLLDNNYAVESENGNYIIINGKRYKTYRNKFSKIVEKQLSSLYIKSHMPSAPPRNIKDKIVYVVRHHGAKIEDKVAGNNRKYKVLKIDGKDYVYSSLNTISQRLEAKLNTIAKNKKFEAVQEVKQKVYQTYKWNDGLKRYAIRNYKADINEV